jgi:hypothetical protein
MFPRFAKYKSPFIKYSDVPRGVDELCHPCHYLQIANLGPLRRRGQSQAPSSGVAVASYIHIACADFVWL